MSGGSKKQTVGYKIFLGLHAILTHGPADRLLRLRWDKRDAWTGSSTGGSININKPGLFGDEEREGGIVGTVDFEQGGPTQGRNSYLQSQLGVDIPAFRGVTGLVMRGIYWGMNPYLKAFSALLQRIHRTSDGTEQWYNSKAGIPSSNSMTVSTAIGLNDEWEYVVREQTEADPGYDDIIPPTDGWSVGTAPFGHVGPGSPPPNSVQTDWPVWNVLWVRKQLTIPADTIMELTSICENGCIFLYGDEVVGADNRDNNDRTESYPVTTVTIGPYGIDRTEYFYVKAFDEIVPPSSNSTTYLQITADNLEANWLDMNPSHIIRECLTDNIWGMGYTDEDIDDTSFMTAADTLFTERMGMSLLWDRQMELKDFIKEVLRHINGVLYVSRTTGKFVLKLIRNDYDVGALPVLGPSEIESIDGHRFAAAGEFVNSVTVNYWDSSTSEDGSVTEQDPALVQMQGAVVNTTLSYPGFTYKDLASQIALRELSTLSTPLHRCNANAPWQVAKELNPGDVFVLNWPEHGISGVVMRILGMSLGDGRRNKVRMQLSQDAFNLPDSGTVSIPDSGWEDPITPPSALTTRLCVEAPYFELVQRSGQATTDDELSVNPEAGYVLATGRRAGSAINARMLTDSGAGYSEVAIADFSPVLELSADVSKTDTVWTVSDVQDADLIEVGMHGQVGNELVKVVSKSGTELVVGRAVLDTVPETHSTGDLIIFWDAFAAADATQYVLGESIDVKLLPSTGAGVLPEEDAPVDTIDMAQRAYRPYPPGNFKVNDTYYPVTVVGTTVDLTWSHRDRKQQTGADLVVFTDGDIGPEDGVSYTVTAYGVDGVGVETLFYTATGITGTSHSIDLVVDTPPAGSAFVSLRVKSVRDSIESLYEQRADVGLLTTPYNLQATYTS